MLSFRVNLARFTKAALDLGFSQDFIDTAADKSVGTLRVVPGPFEEKCVGCDKPLEQGLVITSGGFYAYHLGCLSGFKCSYCHTKLSPTISGYRPISGHIVCTNCSANLKKCVHCEREVPASKLKDGYCRACIVNCNRCLKPHPIPSMYTLRGHYVCRKCGGREIWVKGHDFNPLVVLQFQGKPKNGIYFGVELEIEAGSQDKCVDLAEDITKNFGKYIVIKHDGSLDGKGLNGLEIVTAPGDFDFQQNLWKEFFARGYKFSSADSDRCSTHVHISRQPLKPLQLARMAHFIYAPKNRGLVQNIGGRKLETAWGNRYANIAQNLTVSDLVEVYGGPSYVKRQVGVSDPNLVFPSSQQTIHFRPNRPLVRYSAFNLTNPTTAELRIFCGTSQYDLMMKNIEFCQALIDYCAPVNVSLSQLSDPNSFIRFVQDRRSLYPSLYKFLSPTSAKSFVEKVKKTVSV